MHGVPGLSGILKSLKYTGGPPIRVYTISGDFTYNNLLLLKLHDEVFDSFFVNTGCSRFFNIAQNCINICKSVKFGNFGIFTPTWLLIDNIQFFKIITFVYSSCIVKTSWALPNSFNWISNTSQHNNKK